MAAPIGGGVALTAKEPTRDGGAGFWRILFGAIPVRTRANILTWRALEAECAGRGKTIAIPIYDGKRAPWSSTPGGSIATESVSAVAAGMHFSLADRLYRITSVDDESNVFDCTIWPKVRDAWPAGQALEFLRPLCRVRRTHDLGMSLDLDGLKRGEATVDSKERFRTLRHRLRGLA